MKKFRNIYGSGTMRSGGSLISNLLSVHKDIIILTDIFHFFRHIHKKYEPITNKSNLYKLSGELSTRLKYRTNLIIDKKLFFSNLVNKKPRKYSDLYSCLINTFLAQLPKKKIIGEYANGEWKKIEIFLNFDKKNIAFQVLRDPRAILSSFKKITFSKGYKYLNSIFNWIDAVDCAIQYKSKYSLKRFLLIKFEDIHKNPKKSSKKLCNFLGVRFDKNMIMTKRWKKMLNNNSIFINTSAYNNKNVYGFSTKRIDAWKNNLKDWEIALIDYLCSSRMKKVGYKLSNINTSHSIGIKIMKKDSLLNKRLKVFLRKNKGTDLRLNDPSNPKNWEANQTSRMKFVGSPDYYAYLKEIRLVRKESKKYLST